MASESKPNMPDSPETCVQPVPPELHARVLEALRDVVDPEIGIDIVELGLIYGVDVDGDRVTVRLTMTTPACPMGDQIVRDAEDCIRGCGASNVHVELVWDPPWSPSRMSASAKTALGWSD